MEELPLLSSVIAVGSASDSNQRSRVRYQVRPHTFISPSADSRRAVVSYRRKNVHEVLVTPLGGISLSRKSVVRLIDHPDMTIDYYLISSVIRWNFFLPK